MTKNISNGWKRKKKERHIQDVVKCTHRHAHTCTWKFARLKIERMDAKYFIFKERSLGAYTIMLIGAIRKKNWANDWVGAKCFNASTLFGKILEA